MKRGGVAELTGKNKAGQVSISALPKDVGA
jgi:hypothetical protein